MTITGRDIARAHGMVKSAQLKLERHQAKGEHMVGQISQSVEVAAGALGAGVLAGRYGTLALGPVPVDLAAGVAGHILGFAGLAGKYSEHLHNFSDGFIASWAVKMGVGLGTSWRIKSGQSAFTTSGDVGALGSGYGSSYGYGYPQSGMVSEEELQQMARMI